ncbi:hypothetical protein BB559_004271 [Furculomyces boomerangus]|uniref:BOD1/SHG1 domain-containing protein n=2 Tax=Harpellales TaxID=61421 RepID=A0A2T9Y2B9_9FUNG|nr:hypothetical protein BB559_006502 [Furculomyces boomerangus]PVU91124.1 hypothetical protein BB559_004271 [Furculomyces boomerangus]PWA01468.1 hypothetical protein BB558_002430 [Smittium angustum]
MEDANNNEIISLLTTEIKRCGDFDSLRNEVLNLFHTWEENAEFNKSVLKSIDELRKTEDPNSMDLLQLENKILEALEKDGVWEDLRSKANLKLHESKDFTDLVDSKVINAIKTLFSVETLKLGLLLKEISLDFEPKMLYDHDENGSKEPNPSSTPISNFVESTDIKTYSISNTIIKPDNYSESRFRTKTYHGEKPELDSNIIFVGNVVAASIPLSTIAESIVENDDTYKQSNAKTGWDTAYFEKNLLVIAQIKSVDMEEGTCQVTLVYDQSINRNYSYKVSFREIYQLIGKKNKLVAGDQVYIIKSDFSSLGSSHYDTSHFNLGTAIETKSNGKCMVGICNMGNSKSGIVVSVDSDDIVVASDIPEDTRNTLVIPNAN